MTVALADIQHCLPGLHKLASRRYPNTTRSTLHHVQIRRLACAVVPRRAESRCVVSRVRARRTEGGGDTAIVEYSCGEGDSIVRVGVKLNMQPIFKIGKPDARRVASRAWAGGGIVRLEKLDAETGLPLETVEWDNLDEIWF